MYFFNMRSEIVSRTCALSSLLLIFTIISHYASPDRRENKICDGSPHTEKDFTLTMAPIFKENKYNVCSINWYDRRYWMSETTSNLRLIYFVTPTYHRPEQIPELTRLSHTLMHVARIHWIVADDSSNCSEFVLSVLNRSGLPFTYLSSPRPYINYRIRYRQPRGVANRQAAIKWIKENVNDGILFFGDDDNTYDLELFDEIRKTKKLAMWPVGLIGRFGVSSPVLREGKVIGFFDSWPFKREFPVDMAGFAIDRQYLKNNSEMGSTPGQLENMFLLSSGFKLEDIEPLAKNCTQVLVWHTKTLSYSKRNLRVSMEKINRSSLENTFPLIENMMKMDVVTVDPVNGTTIGFISCAQIENKGIVKKCILTDRMFTEETCCWKSE